MTSKTGDPFEEKRLLDSRLAAEAKSDPSKKERFLADEQVHILKLTSVILRKSITMSDDEFSVSLMATSEAIDSYDPERNDFWPYAGLVIRNRLADYYRKESRSKEVVVAPGTFDGEGDPEEDRSAVSLEVREKITVRSLGVSSGLKDEMQAFEEEIGRYGISFEDLVTCSPKSQKTRKGCADVIRMIFLPPPLVSLVKRSGKLPISEILKRGDTDRKLMDRHRKYLIAATVILSGDYPKLSEYLKYMKPDLKNIIDFEERRIGS